MSEVTTRKVHTPEFKAKVGLEALRGLKTINEIPVGRSNSPTFGHFKIPHLKVA